jgi:hypothetical protein
MSTQSEISTNDIISRAMSIVADAKYEILATMDLAEELANPLPNEYFFLLQEKMNQGVNLNRLAFGTKEEFVQFQKNQPSRPEYACHLAKKGDYRRMLLIDRKELMFATSDSPEKKFFFTEEQKTIERYLKYFFKLFI